MNQVEQIKLACAVSHLLEYIDTGHAFDLSAAMSALKSSDLSQWAADNPVMLPARRDGIAQSRRWESPG